MSAAQSPVIVAGMHRSGTSALTRALSIIGVDLGPEEDLLPPKPDNPEGFWENRHIVQLHDDLLAKLGGRWQDPPLTDLLANGNDFEEYISRATEIVAGFDGERPGFKDPRVSVLLDLWHHVWPDARVVVGVRHPMSVASSLDRREGIDYEHAAALWLRYTFDAMAGYREPVVARYESLIEDPPAFLVALGSRLGLDASEEDLAKAAETVDTTRSADPPDLPGPPSESLSLALWLHDNLERIPPVTFPLLAAGIREPLATASLRGVEERLREVVAMSDRSHEELIRAQHEFRRASLTAEAREQALAREERAREDLATTVSRLEAEIHDLQRHSGEMEDELSWRRALQYRMEKVLGRRMVRRLSGHEDSR